MRGLLEFGFLSALSHRIQFGKEGTELDYVEDGGQDVLFPVGRISAELDLGASHRFILLYQPLKLRTRVRLDEDLQVETVRFPAGTPVEMLYDFPFYRASYLYDVWESSEEELSFGASLQIRSATIEFASLDGTLLRSDRGVGPVPALKMRLRRPIGERWWFGLEVDGMYAPVSYLNGSDEEITGAILDASVRLGLRMTEAANLFLNLRYLGGGATGTDEDDAQPGDGYTDNWLHFVTVTLGGEHALL